MQVHCLEEIIVRLQGKHVELSWTAGVFIYDEVAGLGVDSRLVRRELLLVDLRSQAVSKVRD